jgi:hypothetical protein
MKLYQLNIIAIILVLFSCNKPDAPASGNLSLLQNTWTDKKIGLYYLNGQPSTIQAGVRPGTTFTFGSNFIYYESGSGSFSTPYNLLPDDSTLIFITQLSGATNDTSYISSITNSKITLHGYLELAGVKYIRQDTLTR